MFCTGLKEALTYILPLEGVLALCKGLNAVRAALGANSRVHRVAFSNRFSCKKPLTLSACKAALGANRTGLKRLHRVKTLPQRE
jgi:hypothetical protein